MPFGDSASKGFNALSRFLCCEIVVVGAGTPAFMGLPIAPPRMPQLASSIPSQQMASSSTFAYTRELGVFMSPSCSILPTSTSSPSSVNSVSQ